MERAPISAIDVVPSWRIRVGVTPEAPAAWSAPRSLAPFGSPSDTAQIRLYSEQLRALKLLASAGPCGCSEALLLAHGFTTDVLIGLATKHTEP